MFIVHARETKRKLLQTVQNSIGRIFPEDNYNRRTKFCLSIKSRANKEAKVVKCDTNEPEIEWRTNSKNHYGKCIKLKQDSKIEKTGPGFKRKRAQKAEESKEAERRKSPRSIWMLSPRALSSTLYQSVSQLSNSLSLSLSRRRPKKSMVPFLGLVRNDDVTLVVVTKGHDDVLVSSVLSFSRRRWYRRWAKHRMTAPP